MSNVETTLLVRENRRKLLGPTVSESHRDGPMSVHREVVDLLRAAYDMCSRNLSIHTSNLSIAFLLPLTATFDFALYYVIYFDYVLHTLVNPVSQSAALSTRYSYIIYQLSRRSKAAWQRNKQTIFTLIQTRLSFQEVCLYCSDFG